jgi:hypothetical protein
LVIVGIDTGERVSIGLLFVPRYKKCELYEISPPNNFYIFFTPLREIFTLFLRETEVEFIYANEVTSFYKGGKT